MNIISRAIREWCDINCNEYADDYDCGELRAIADRIDREMVELPKDADGEPIHIGDVVYGNNGVAWTVAGLRISEFGWRVRVGKYPYYCVSGILTHKEPEPDDSLERIVEELEEWSEDNRINGNREVFDRAGDLADRIRKLAETLLCGEEGGRTEQFKQAPKDKSQENNSEFNKAQFYTVKVA